jgi:predicted HicB family RNase H-like nuclease
MTKKDLQRPRGRGRPAKGFKKMTFRLPPDLAGALAKAKKMTGRDQNQLVAEALRQFLRLGN